jgi:hypothetical protein
MPSPELAKGIDMPNKAEDFQALQKSFNTQEDPLIVTRLLIELNERLKKAEEQIHELMDKHDFLKPYK